MFKLNKKLGTAKERTHVFLFIKYTKNISKPLNLEMRKKEQSKRRKCISSYDKNTFMKI